MDNNKNTYVKRQEFIENDPLLKSRRGNSAIIIFTYLYNLWVHSGKNPWCSNATIANATQIGTESVRKTLKWLEDTHYIMRGFKSKTGTNLREFTIIQNKETIIQRTLSTQLINSIDTKSALWYRSTPAMVSKFFTMVLSTIGYGIKYHRLWYSVPPAMVLSTTNNILDNKIYNKEERERENLSQKTNTVPTDSNDSLSFLKNNSLENKSEQPQSPPPSERANKPQPLTSYLETISNNATRQEEQRGVTNYNPPAPKDLYPEEIAAWEQSVKWCTENLSARGIKTPFKDIFMAYVADCKGKAVMPSKQGVLGWVKREDDRNYKEPQKYNPRSPTPNTTLHNQPKQLTEEELAEKEEARKKATEIAESVARSRHAAQVVKENPDYFTDLLKLPIYKRQILLSQAGCTTGYYSKETILQKLKDINYGR